MKKLIYMCVFMFSASLYAETQLPAEIFSELQSEAKMQKGDVLYVDFWASWCAPCRKSFPWMHTIQEKYHDKGLKVIAINVDKERELADVFLDTVPNNFTIVYDPDGALASVFHVQGMPSSFIVDDEGHIKITHKGFFENKTEVYEQEIRSLIHN